MPGVTCPSCGHDADYAAEIVEGQVLLARSDIVTGFENPADPPPGPGFASSDRTSEVASSVRGVRVVDEPEKGLVKARERGRGEARPQLRLLAVVQPEQVAAVLTVAAWLGFAEGGPGVYKIILVLMLGLSALGLGEVHGDAVRGLVVHIGARVAVAPPVDSQVSTLPDVRGIALQLDAPAIRQGFEDVRRGVLIHAHHGAAAAAERDGKDREIEQRDEVRGHAALTSFPSSGTSRACAA